MYVLVYCESSSGTHVRDGIVERANQSNSSGVVVRGNKFQMKSLWCENGHSRGGNSHRAQQNPALKDVLIGTCQLQVEVALNLCWYTRKSRIRKPSAISGRSTKNKKSQMTLGYAIILEKILLRQGQWQMTENTLATFPRNRQAPQICNKHWIKITPVDF